MRITLKRAYADGAVAVELDPLSQLCRLATSVPPPRFHTVKCSQAAPVQADSPPRGAAGPASRLLKELRRPLRGGQRRPVVGFRFVTVPSAVVPSEPRRGP